MESKKDTRSPLAFFRDQWFESQEGASMLSTDILKSPGMLRYLKNRLESAYLAGAQQFSGGKIKSDGKDTMADVDISQLNQRIITTLDKCKTGILWYRDNYQDSQSPADGEVMDEIDEIIKLLEAQ